jgi:DNA-binding response OmpR family regulator
MTQRILVAEDELVIAFDLCETVAEAGYEVEGPHAGVSAAMLAFQKDKPDLAILDINLDDGNVFQLAQTLAAENVPIIFHSGHHTREEVAVHFPQAMTLTKPCPPTEMIETVNRVLSPLA